MGQSVTNINVRLRLLPLHTVAPSQLNTTPLFVMDKRKENKTRYDTAVYINANSWHIFERNELSSKKRYALHSIAAPHGAILLYHHEIII